MANKRTASTNLNHDNWDDDEEPETFGKFQTAQPSVIASRQIKLATRRLNTSRDGTSDTGTSKEACPQKAPSETIFSRLGVNFAGGQSTPKTTMFSRSVIRNVTPELANANQWSPSALQPASPDETKTMENNGSMQDKASAAEESPGASAFKPLNPANVPFTLQLGLPAASGSKFIVDATTVDKPLVSSDKNTWRQLTTVKPSQPINEENDTPIMPGLETRPVAESKSCEPSMDTEILGQKDSRHLLKPVPDDILARLKTKSEATGKSLNFLKRTYQLNTTTLDWLNILIKESLTVNVAEVIPSYMHELLKLIEEEITSQESDDAKQQLIPHKNQLQKMLGIFQQFGFLVEDENSSKSEILPERSNDPSTSTMPLITNSLESSPQSSKSTAANQDATLKPKSESQEMKQNLSNVQNNPCSMTLNENHGNKQQDNEQIENDEEPPKVDSFTPVVEEGSICTMRCKVFVKKVLDPSDPFDTPYQNRGVGSLYVKPIGPGKLQLVIRADNSLGNIILNTCITPDIPIEVANSNTLMLVCCPMPGDIARTVLIRVKNKLLVDLLHINLVTI